MEILFNIGVEKGGGLSKRVAKHEKEGSGSEGEGTRGG